MTSITDLYNNIIALLGNYFYKTEEKPTKYNEWLTSEYANGKWYIGEEAPEISIFSQNIESVEATPLQANAIYRVVIYCGTDIDDNQLKTGWAFSSPSNHMIIFAGTIDRIALQQTQTITIEPYLDSENNIFYTGCSWTGTITL